MSTQFQNWKIQTRNLDHNDAMTSQFATEASERSSTHIWQLHLPYPSRKFHSSSESGPPKGLNQMLKLTATFLDMHLSCKRLPQVSTAKWLLQEICRERLHLTLPITLLRQNWQINYSLHANDVFSCCFWLLFRSTVKRMLWMGWVMNLLIFWHASVPVRCHKHFRK